MQSKVFSDVNPIICVCLMSEIGRCHGVTILVWHAIKIDTLFNVLVNWQSYLECLTTHLWNFGNKISMAWFKTIP